MSPTTLLSLAALALVSSAQAGRYELVEKHADQTFFNGWKFADAPDITTSGDVLYVNSSSSPSLAYVNEKGNAILKVSTEDIIYNEKRPSVRLDLETTHDVGTVWVFDAVHLPYGCSVWPAFWMHSDTWPVGGEIDVFEGINLSKTNQMAMHTIAGCEPSHDPTQISGGTVGVTNCNATVGSGCTVMQTNEASYGAGFNSAGGGVWVTELAETGVSIWFWSRPEIPAGVSKTATTIDTSTLGLPVAFWPSTGCSPISDFISKQRTVLDITLCGVWAGVDANLEATGCAVPVAPRRCYEEYVMVSSNYAEAYFEIPYMNIYSSNADVKTVSTTPAFPSTTGSAKASGTSTAKTSATATSSTVGEAANTGGALARIDERAGTWAVGMALVIGSVAVVVGI